MLFFGTFKIKSTNTHRLKNFINLLLLLAFSFSSIAQEKWDLQKCLRQAKENNLEILKQKLLIDVAKSNLKSSKLSLLPNFNAFSSQGYNFGRAIDPLTNDFTIEFWAKLESPTANHVIFHQGAWGNSGSIGKMLSVYYNTANNIYLDFYLQNHKEFQNTYLQLFAYR